MNRSLPAASATGVRQTLSAFHVTLAPVGAPFASTRGSAVF